MENTKTIKIVPPKGYEIDKDNSTIYEIVFKRKEKYPMYISEVPDRDYYITSLGEIKYDNMHNSLHATSNKHLSIAIKALTMLIELNKAWNKVDKFTPDWSDLTQTKYSIICQNYVVEFCTTNTVHRNLVFGSKETRKLFMKTFRDLLEQAKTIL